MTFASSCDLLWGSKVNRRAAVKLFRCFEARSGVISQAVQPLQVLSYEAAILAACSNDSDDRAGEHGFGRSLPGEEATCGASRL